MSGKTTFGLFFDYPSKLTFDIGYARMDTLKVSCENADVDIYVIEGENAYDIVKQFRHVIGRSYIPPKFAFGFGQSRWGYTTKEDFRTVAKGYRENHIPIDMIYMDIDYMQSFKDFTLSEENFRDFPEFVQEMKDQDLRLIPIIDAGVKVEPGYDVYEEGVKNNYFCKREDGSDFVAAVWPGDTHFPDMLNKDARKWFGDKYRFLIEQGIDGFWNDMNEPAIFYSSEGLSEAKELAGEFAKDTEGKIHPWAMQAKMKDIANNPEDYRRFYHNVDGKKIRLYRNAPLRWNLDGRQQILVVTYPSEPQDASVPEYVRFHVHRRRSRRLWRRCDQRSGAPLPCFRRIYPVNA